MDTGDKQKAFSQNIEFAGDGKQGSGGGTVGEILLVSGQDEIRRVPVPTNDPNDPLNLSKWRKIGVTVTCCWFSVFSLLAISGTGPFMATLYGLYGAQGHSPEEITGLNTYSTMVMAFGALGLLPLAFVFGRRPIFLFAVTLAFVSNITAATSENFRGHFISRIFLGLATGATESLLPLILSDITFLHERSFYFGLYWSVQNCVNSGLLIAISYLVADATWRWFYWLFSITLGVSALLVVFCCPETKFHRSPTSLNGQVIFTDEFGHTQILTDDEAIAAFGSVDGPAEVVAEKKTFAQELKPWSPVTPNGTKVLLGAYLKIFKSFTSPGVIFSLMMSSISLGVGIAITLVYSTVLQESYHWSPKSVGLFNAGVMPACFAAMFYSGWAADKINVWLARRNGGVHKPEHHLVHMIVPGLAGIVGIVLIAVCAERPDKYSAWGMVVGWAIYEFSFTAIIITTTTFAAEVIPENPGAAMVVVVGGKNIVSFGAAQGIIPMVAKFSYLTSFMILLGIFSGICLLGVPVYFLNSRWRKIATRAESQ
ncbi:MFS general substrate transporter [Paraphaeosphaeria sporulosa]|uniref:MFS general substrate transporter n=1 Tax=Paraphaeosphaeria sporulosa TaxID=1460663 RepID=A0A177CVJ7_9PLEO|nr:MFS general substrate transporter [Paraphaeosphaeria sporulosa]OAG11553.1 MFS general substrate transporter [Paraphaeosphaeria sporulosa]